MTTKKINIIRKTGQGYSYYVDANGILKGEWGGFEENPCLVLEKKVYWIYYSKFSKSIPIDENGNFYLKFSCAKYDGVLELSENLFLCEKDNRYGVIDNNGNYILHTAFRKISYIKRDLQGYSMDLFIVETESGVFLYNLSNKTESKEYSSIMNYTDEYFMFEENGKFGLIDNNGTILVNAILKKRDYCYSYKDLLYTELLGYGFTIYYANDKIYGQIPIDKYDKCVKLGGILDGFYITYKNKKYGLLNNCGETIVDPCLDEVYLYDGVRNPYKEIKFTHTKSGTWVNLIYVIVKMNNKFALYDVVSGECKIEDCEEMKFIIGPKRIKPKENDFIRFKKNGEIGYVTTGGYIIDKNHFDNYIMDGLFWIVSKNEKWGVLRLSGFEYIPCIFDEIKNIGYGEFKAKKDGVTETLGEYYDPWLNENQIYYGRREMMQDTWDAMTDGQYGDMPDGFDGDFDFLGY